MFAAVGVCVCVCVFIQQYNARSQKRCQSPPSLSSYKQRVTSIKPETMLRFFLKLGGGAVALQQATPPVLPSRQIRPGSGAPALPLQPCIFTRSSRPRVPETPRPADLPFPSTSTPSTSSPLSLVTFPFIQHITTSSLQVEQFRRRLMVSH